MRIRLYNLGKKIVIKFAFKNCKKINILCFFLFLINKTEIIVLYLIIFDMNCIISQVTIRLFGLCAFYVVYLFIGAAIFSAIEYDNEENLINELKLKRQEFLSKNKQCLNGKFFSVNHVFVLRYL
jgi:membrane-bound ClpP family serine protease